MANNKDFKVKEFIEVGGSIKSTIGTITKNVVDTSYDLANASYDNILFDPDEATQARTCTFKPDGTKLFIANNNSDIFQYSLSLPWNVGSASYDNKTYNPSEDTDPKDVKFKTDGTKMYIVGDSTDVTYQYSLSTAWDVSTATYDSKSFTSSEATGVRCIVFKPDGLTAFFIGTDEVIYQYTLSTAWDISTMTYASKSFSVTNDDDAGGGFTFNTDGTKLFYIGSENDKVVQYTLSTAWDISTASKDTINFAVGAQNTVPVDIAFKSDGTRMFICGFSGGQIYQYTTGTFADEINLDTGNYFTDSPSADTTYKLKNAADTQLFQLELTGGLDAVGESFGSAPYRASGSTDTIVNNLDLSTDGGMVWIKSRSETRSHHLYDTERGVKQKLKPDDTDAVVTNNTGLTAFNSNGFKIGSASGVGNASEDYISWSWKKTPKFFDVVTYTGTGVARTVSHSLGSVPGMIIIKRTDSATSWNVYHRNLNGGTNPHQYGINLNTTGAEFASSGYWNNTAPTSTEFTVGTSGNANASGGTYVAYLFAHNDNDGGFGPNSDQDIIKCGTFTEKPADNVTVNLGFEPQWIIIKVTSTTGGWGIYDINTGWASNTDSYALTANDNVAEANVGDRWQIHPYGFSWKPTGNTRDIIYMAIRKSEDLLLTWPNNLNWPTGSILRSPDPNQKDIFTISTDDGGTTYNGLKTGDNFS